MRQLNAWHGISLGFFFAAAGCGAKVETENVSGTVSYKGSPLSGGSITLVSESGKTFGGGISDTGSFSLQNVPTGPCKVLVDNTNLKMLEAISKNGGLPPGAPKDAPKMESMPAPKGHYVRLPEKYKTAETTDLSINVAKGQQTYPIELK